jgi:hypothetical protein
MDDRGARILKGLTQVRDAQKMLVEYDQKVWIGWKAMGKFPAPETFTVCCG